MKVIKVDNIFNHVENEDVVCITTNGNTRKDGGAVMGRGIAKQVSSKSPSTQKLLGNYLTKYGNRCFNLGKYKVNNNVITLASFPTKNNWNENSSLELIKESVKQITDMANKFNWKRVYIPAPGCGNGKLKWKDEVEPIVRNLDDRFIIMFQN